MAQAWRVVALLWPVACLNYLDRLMIATVRESIKAEITMTDAQFGLLTSVFLWVYAVLSLPAGFLADRFGRSRVVVGEIGGVNRSRAWRMRTRTNSGLEWRPLDT